MSTNADNEVTGNPLPKSPFGTLLSRVRFQIAVDDYRPVAWPIPYPYWCSAHRYEDKDPSLPDSEDNEQIVWTIVAMVPTETADVYIKTFWPEHREVDFMSEGHLEENITYTERFPKPEWYTSPVQDAWEELKKWYANCITAAPKPDVEGPNLTFHHIFTWCRNWDISTEGPEAICQKYGVPVPEPKAPSAEVNGEDTVPPAGKITCIAPVACVLLSLRGEKVYGGYQAQIHAGPLNLQAGDYEFHYAYQDHDGPSQRTHAVTPLTGVFDLIHTAALDFEAIYGVKDPETGTAAVKRPPYHPVGLQMKSKSFDSDPKVTLADPFIIAITIDQGKKTIVFSFMT